MAKMYVDVEALNFRKAAVVEPGNRIAILHLGQQLETLSDADQNGWVKVRADVEGTAREGLVSGKFLRNPVAKAREALVAEAISEWLRFERGIGRETVDPFFKVCRRNVGRDQPVAGRQRQRRTLVRGRDLVYGPQCR